ncbi:MAG: hypothetical protein RSG77_21795, partial [Hafnia sp.]
MGNFSMRQLGLSPDEAKALIACAHDRRKDVQSRVSEYDLQEESRTLKTLKKAESEGKVLPHQVFELLAVRNLMGASVERFLPLKFEAKYETEHGYFTEHESFGCMSHSCPTSTHPTFVGTPTLDSTMVCLRFHRASLKSTRQSTNEPTLGDTSTMYEFDLSADQFAGLMRDSNAGSPCAIGRQYLVSLDMPPRMV